MSDALEDAWDAVITNITGPASVAALVAVLDRCQALDEIKQRVLAEAAAELRADHERPAHTYGNYAARWLRDQLADGERRAQQLKADAARDGIGWRTVERHKRAVLACARRHDGCSWWSIETSLRRENSATPPTPTAPIANL